MKKTGLDLPHSFGDDTPSMSMRDQVGLTTLKVVDGGSWDAASLQITSKARTRGTRFIPRFSKTQGPCRVGARV